MVLGMFALGGLIKLVFALGVCSFGLVAMAFWIWMLVDCVTKEPTTGNDRLIWVLIVVLASWIGALIYYFVRRPERRKLYGR